MQTQSRNIGLSIFYLSSLRCFLKLWMKEWKNYDKKMIFVTQNAFINGRNIMDGIISLNESKRMKQQGEVLQIDFEEAYDKVNWNFLFNNLRNRVLRTNEWNGLKWWLQEGILML